MDYSSSNNPTPEELRELAKSLDWWAGDSRTELKQAARHLRKYAELLAHPTATPLPPDPPSEP